MVKFNTGNFTLNINGEFNDAAKADALEAGLRYVTQRDVATAVYIQLAGEKNSKGNLSLPDGFKRESVEFNADNAAAMELAANEALKKYGNFTVTVEENVGGETAAEPGKMATALWNQVKENPAMRTAMGVAENATEEEGIASARAFLAALKGKKTEETPAA